LAEGIWFYPTFEMAPQKVSFLLLKAVMQISTGKNKNKKSVQFKKKPQLRRSGGLNRNWEPMT
jgi:hypothetical protein